jgi:glycosyltransferase involved in cell wall biosynthesis
MRILFVHEVDWLKKVVFDIHSLADALSVLDHRVYAIDYEDMWERKGSFDFGSLRTREVDGVSRAIPQASISLRRPGFIRIPGLSRLSAACTHYLEIRRTLKEENIDVVMLYSVPTNGLQTIRLARRFNIPVVFRSIDILHRLVRYLALRLPTRFLERKVYSAVDEILAITPNHSRYVISMGADESKVTLLPLPVDTTIFRPYLDASNIRQKWGFSEKDQIIVFIGTLFEFSGLDRFIQNFPQVVGAIPEARLLVVGDGPQRPRLEQIIRKLGLGKQVIITGFQPYATMPQYINLATVCVNPFLNTPATKDIFPGKIIQYLACGKATVGTPLLGITSLIPDESQGVVYADSPADMAEKVISLMKSLERRQKLGQAGVEYVRKMHDQRKIAHQLESGLLDIVNRSERTDKE